eukprot:7383337-Prymnesium_polylepis.3
MMVTHIGDALMTVCSALFVSYQHFCGWPRLLAPSVRRFGCNGAGNLAITTRPGESNPRSGEDQATLEEQVQRKEQTFDTERLVARTITHQWSRNELPSIRFATFSICSAHLPLQ